MCQKMQIASRKKLEKIITFSRREIDYRKERKQRHTTNVQKEEESEICTAGKEKENRKRKKKD